VYRNAVLARIFGFVPMSGKKISYKSKPEQWGIAENGATSTVE
jgi:hypothetical protein